MRSLFVVLGVGVVAVVACGGKFTTVDGNKPVNNLGATDADQLCHDEYNYVVGSFSVDDFAKISCSSQVDSTDCQSAFDTCVAQAKTNATWPPPGGPDCNAFNQALAQCNTTVSQYSECIQEEVNVLKSIESKVPFCTQGAEESAFLQAEGQVSTQCLDLLQKCPLQFSSSTASPIDAGTTDGG